MSIKVTQNLNSYPVPKWLLKEHWLSCILLILEEGITSSHSAFLYLFLLWSTASHNEDSAEYFVILITLTYSYLFF